MLRLYYSPGACSLASHIVLYQTAVPFEARRVVIAEGAHRRAEYLAINPRARVPALQWEGGVLTENIAILSYLAHRFPSSRALPLDHAERLGRCEELLAYFASSVHIAFAQVWRPERFSDDTTIHPAIVSGGRQSLARYFDEIEKLLQRDGWIVGDHFTAADTYPFLFYRWGRRLGEDMSRFPAWTRHTQRLLGWPAATSAIAAEGLQPTEFVAAEAVN